jgi:hypothetical protein
MVNNKFLGELLMAKAYMSREEWYLLMTTGSVKGAKYPKHSEYLIEKDGILAIDNFNPYKIHDIYLSRDEFITANESTARYFGIDKSITAFFMSTVANFFRGIAYFVVWSATEPSIYVREDASIEDRRMMAKLCLLHKMDGLGMYLAGKRDFFYEARIEKVCSTEELMQLQADILFIDMADPSKLLDADKRIENFLDATIGK